MDNTSTSAVIAEPEITLQEVYRLPNITRHKQYEWTIDPHHPDMIIRGEIYVLMPYGTKIRHNYPEIVLRQDNTKLPTSRTATTPRELTPEIVARLVETHNAQLEAERVKKGRMYAEFARRWARDPSLEGVSGDAILEAATKLKATDDAELSEGEEPYPLGAYSRALQVALQQHIEDSIKDVFDFVDRDVFDWRGKLEGAVTDWRRSEKAFPSYKCPKCGQDMAWDIATEDRYRCVNTECNTTLKEVELAQ